MHELEAQLGVTIPEGKAGLALWINLASINRTRLQLGTVEGDAEGMNDMGIEMASIAQNMYVEGQRVPVTQNLTDQDAQPLPNRMSERFKFRFETANATLAGFFKFVPQALLRDPSNQTIVKVADVTASYIAAGAHMRVYIGYPYFGNLTLEHDPSIGLEALPTLVTWPLILTLLGAVTVIVVAVLVIRWRRGPVNMLKPN